MNIINFIRDIFHEPFFICLLAIISCACFYYLERAKNGQKIVWTVHGLVFAGALVIFVFTGIYRIYHPQIWDYTVFYLYGSVAATGQDFYLPENFQQVYSTIHLPFTDHEGLVEEIVNVGFLYPPPTMFYFLPLGYMSYTTGLVIWTIFNLFFVFGCLYLIYDQFFRQYGLNGLFLGSTLFLILVPSLSTISSSQTNFILLFFLLLMKKYSRSKWAGLYLALAFFTKPYMLVCLMFFVAIKNWKAIGYFILSSAVIAGLALAVFGIAPFRSFIFNSPIERIPHNIFEETTNQSLHAVLLRAGVISMDRGNVYTYIGLAVIAFFGVYAIYLLRRKAYDYFWALSLLIGLIVYPNTQTTYGVLLLFIIDQFFDTKKELGLSTYLAIPVIAVFYYLSTFSLFGSMCLLLGVIIIKSLLVQPGLRKELLVR